MTTTTEIRPQRGPQEAVLASSADIVIAGGAAGGGKTWGLLVEPLRHVCNPSFGAVIFRRTYKQVTAEGGLWDESYELYPHLDAEPNQQDHEWRFPSGSRITFAHMQHDKNRLDWKGAQIALIGFDQLEEFTERQFWYLLSRNRSMCGVRPYVRATCNPVPDDDDTGGWLHRLISWWLDEDTGYPFPDRSGVVRWFVRVGDDLVWGDSAEELRAAHPRLPPKSLTFIPARLEDNAILMAQDPGYMGNLLALPMVERERLLGGNWKIRPSAGKVFNRAWFGDALPAKPIGGTRVRYWDKAATEGGGALTAGVLMCRDREGRYVIEDVVTGQWSAGQREAVMKQTAAGDGPSVLIVVEQEPGSGGKESAQNSVRNLAGYEVRLDRATGDKYERAGPMSAQCEVGNVKLVRASWNDTFLRRAHAFAPGGSEHKDDVDAAVGAFNWLVKNPASQLVGIHSLGTEDFSGPSPWTIE